MFRSIAVDQGIDFHPIDLSVGFLGNSGDCQYMPSAEVSGNKERAPQPVVMQRAQKIQI